MNEILKMNIEIQNGRILWIDAARGIAILLVILGHCIGSLDDPGNKVILSFHMPLFFFISGFWARKEKEFLDYLLKKVKGLLVPTITLGVFDTLVDLVSGEINRETLADNFFGWFLLVLFYVSIIFYIIQKLGFEKKMYIRLLTYVIDFLSVVIVDRLQIITLPHFEIIPMALFFFMCGYHCKISYSRLTKSNNIIFDIWILLIPIGIICSSYNAPVAMYLNDYGNIFLFFMDAFIGIVVVCKIGGRIQNNQLLIWFGQNTIYFYVLHFSFIKGLHFIRKVLFPKCILSNYSYPIYWVYYILSILLLIPASMLCRRWFSPLFGKSKSKRKK